jgi:VanZ family protein
MIKANFKSWGPVIIWLTVMITATSMPNLRPPDRFPHSDLLFHLVAYLVLAVLVSRGLKLRGAKSKWLWAGMLLFGLALAAIDEYHEVLIPGRTVSFLDFSLNVIGYAAGTGLGEIRYKRMKEEDEVQGS